MYCFSIVWRIEVQPSEWPGSSPSLIWIWEWHRGQGIMHRGKR